ncbi:MAG: DUF1638 domain-containing protein [Pirellulales bacterium]|nr:DUF1638 domain-containing protein [Pirellulales bacterium]
MTDSIHVIACGVLAIDLEDIARRLGLRLTTDFLPGGLHDRPHELRRRLQEAIDQASAVFRGERIVVGYGVCGLGSVGIHARNVPLVIPRVNDCIAMFLGSDRAYREQFVRYPGTYYISAGWVEGKAQPQSPEGKTHCGPDCYTFAQLVAAYGEENAEAIRRFLTSWQRNYQRAAFIDTGARGKSRYAEIAQAMAKALGWKYEEIPGSSELMERLLAAHQSTDEILLVPPHHVTAYDAVSKTLKAVPVWEAEDAAEGRDHTLVFDDAREEPEDRRPVRLGLGIDAGGTYTDVVLYDFSADRVLLKAKAPTTKWDFTIGIEEALDRLDPEKLAQVDLVTISTTLATNAIVEGRGQKVGMMVFPPYGLWHPSHIAYRPIAVLQGKLEIDGRELVPIDPAQIRAAAAEMLRQHQVGAFAVTGYASHANPAHELAAQAILREATGLHVTCGHEVSEGLNYRVRAVTAALNASIIPCLDSFLNDVEVSLRRRGIGAPQMVVKSDGSLMSLPVARRRPIETILSGPAASVAGASYLAGLPDAVVVDMGGTTTDTATIRGGRVATSEKGATVGGWRTHVRALDMRTLGLGGDSLITLERGEVEIGPQRVAPVAWLCREDRGLAALDWLEDRLDRYRGSTRPMELLALNGHARHDGYAPHELRILELLSERPHSLHELAERTQARRWEFLDLDRLELRHAVQRCGLTPTDVLHAAGRISLWNTRAAERICAMFCRLMGMSREAFSQWIHDQITRRLAAELLKMQLAEHGEARDGDRSPAADSLVNNWLDGGTDDFRIRVELKHALVGIGAPVHLFLPAAAKLLETEAIIPPHADVANAIGAITSRVSVRHHVEISPGDNGRYAIAGLPEARWFADFHEANRFALEELTRLVRHAAREAGTSASRVEIRVHDRVAPTAMQSPVFIGRTLSAHLSGRPDVARLKSELVADSRGPNSSLDGRTAGSKA